MTVVEKIERRRPHQPTCYTCIGEICEWMWKGDIFWSTANIENIPTGVLETMLIAARRVFTASSLAQAIPLIASEGKAIRMVGNLTSPGGAVRLSR